MLHGVVLPRVESSRKTSSFKLQIKPQVVGCSLVFGISLKISITDDQDSGWKLKPEAANLRP
jgi:hypothetical protein